MLSLLAQKIPRIFIVLDALDECSEENGMRQTFLEEIQCLSSNVQILITSRHSMFYQDEPYDEQVLNIVAQDEDIRNFLRKQIRREPRLVRHVRANQDLEDLILKNITEKANGV